MEGNVVTQLVFPISLFLIMLGMGLTLALEDFRRILEFPRALLVGLACQMIGLPLLALALVSVVPLRPSFALGLLILSFCPGGAVSNVVSFLARGNLALSIALTAVTSVVSPFVIPVLTNLALARWAGEGAAISLPLGPSVAALVVLTLVPVALGMLIHYRRPDFAKRAEKTVKRGSALVILLALFAFVSLEWRALPGWFAEVGLACLGLSFAAMAMGYAASLLARLPRIESTTISIEVGIQNVVTALFVTGTLLGQPQLAMVPAVYALVMLFTSQIFVLRGAKRPAEAEAAKS